jgi:hypothetical protein
LLVARAKSARLDLEQLTGDSEADEFEDVALPDAE